VTVKFPRFGANQSAESHIKQQRSMKSQFDGILNTRVHVASEAASVLQEL